MKNDMNPPIKKLLIISRSLGVGGGVPVALVNMINVLPQNVFDLTIGLEQPITSLSKNIKREVKIVCYNTNHSRLFSKLVSFRDKNKNKNVFRLFIKIINQIEKKAKIISFKKSFDGHYDIACAYHQGLATKLVSKYIKASSKYMFFHSSIIMPDIKECFFIRADKIIVMNKYIIPMLTKEWKRIDASKYISLNPFVDEKEIYEKSNEYVVENNKFMLTTISRLTWEKGIDIIVDCSKLLKQRGIKFIWYIVGDGPLHSFFSGLLKMNNLDDDVVLVGEKENPYPYIKYCDLLVSPSSYETCSLSVIESRALGKPIIGTKTFSSMLLINNKFDGFIVDDACDMADKIMLFAEGSDLSKTIINNARNYDYSSYKNSNIEIIKSLFNFR